MWYSSSLCLDGYSTGLQKCDEDKMAKKKKRRYKKSNRRKAMIYAGIGIVIFIAIVISVKMIA